MNLIYLYPNLDDAPARVGKEIVKYLIKFKDNLPFNNIILLSSKRSSSISSLNLQIIDFSDLKDYKEDYIVHIPISPIFLPNKKLWVQLFCILKKKSFILHYHGDFRKTILSRLKYERYLDFMILPSAVLIPYILKSATRVIVHSHLLNDIVRNDYGVDQSHVIPNGLDDYWFQPLESNKFIKFIDKEKKNIFYHGRLSPEKGVDILIESFRKFIIKNPDTMLYIAGDGFQEKILQLKCEKLNIRNNVIFLGNVDRDVIKYFLINVDIAIYPSRFDAFCMSILEAFASANCPVFFSENAGITDFVKSDDFELNYFNPTVENIYNILNSAKLNDKNIIDNQKKFAQKYSWDNVILEYIKLYKDIVNI